MRTIKDALTDLAIEMGYDGEEPTSIKEAVLDIADTLAGEDTGDAETIAAAIDILAQYVDKEEGGDNGQG